MNLRSFILHALRALHRLHCARWHASIRRAEIMLEYHNRCASEIHNTLYPPRQMMDDEIEWALKRTTPPSNFTDKEKP